MYSILQYILLLSTVKLTESSWASTTTPPPPPPTLNKKICTLSRRFEASTIYYILTWAFVLFYLSANPCLSLVITSWCIALVLIYIYNYISFTREMDVHPFIYNFNNESLTKNTIIECLVPSLYIYTNLQYIISISFC